MATLTRKRLVRTSVHRYRELGWHTSNRVSEQTFDISGRHPSFRVRVSLSAHQARPICERRTRRMASMC